MSAAAPSIWASGAWLTPQRMRFVAALMLAGTVVALIYLVATATGTASIAH